MAEKKKSSPLSKVIILVVVVALGYLLWKSGAFEYLKDREKLESLLASFGIWGPVVFIGLYALGTLLISFATPLTILGGVIFGPVMGLVYVALGAWIGLTLSFLMSRYVVRNLILDKFGNSDAFKKIDEGVKKEGWFILAVTRFLPIVPFGVQNYLYGITGIRFLTYTVLSCIFILPGTAIYVILSGAIASGDKALATKYGLIATGIFLALTLLTKFLKTQVEKKNKVEG